MNPACPHCGSTSNRRIARKKNLKHRVLYFFRLFPWECLSCQQIFFSQIRYSRSHRHPQGEVYIEDSSKQPRVKPGSEERHSQ
jgi:hypothetical protein